MKIGQKLSFLKVSGKMACRFEFSVIFYVFQHRSKLIFDIFSKMTFFNMKTIKNCINLNPRRLPSRTLELDESFQLMCFTSPELRSASSYGHFTAAKEFWSQCHILLFFDNLAVLVPYMSYIVYFHKLSNYMGKRQLRIQECQFLKSV